MLRGVRPEGLVIRCDACGTPWGCFCEELAAVTEADIAAATVSKRRQRFVNRPKGLRFK